MPNYCNYSMKVRGTKEGVEEFVKVMKSNGNYTSMEFGFERHMGSRVFEADVWDMYECDDYCEASISGYCAWSVACCMNDDDFSYYQQLKSKYGKDCKSTTLQLESQNLNLDIEVYSSETGMCFAEHYRFRDGECLADECVDYMECFLGDFETKEEAEEFYEIEIPQDVWDHEEYCIVGGFGDYIWFED